jgi:hypothetical protein
MGERMIKLEWLFKGSLKPVISSGINLNICETLSNKVKDSGV